ncbi:hypothetical protein DZ956_022355 [Pseudomonas aeruginosa]|uniref:hypothetical protein n=1 Tax=Pseudomonas aeruginosa TaxID=287 RepID=UPI000E312326|nr:hypothetical protein [Pseudomonas aeruginosa]NPZ19520.1 hypothetical protein [Pseudomonas aeruginosa]
MMLPEGYVVVTLRPTMFGQDSVEEGAMVAVSREVRSNLVAGNIARDATDEEIAEYRAGEEDADAMLADVEALAGQKRALEGEIERLQARKNVLAADQTSLEGVIAHLGEQKDALDAEVKKLEAAKAAAAKPATAAKSK